MLYGEFLEGTGAVDNEASYAEYKRVEQIYMESDHCTKQDAYRMARVVTVAEHEREMKKARKAELDWVKENIFAAASFVRGMSEKQDYFRKDFSYRSPAGNVFVLRKVRQTGSETWREFFCNGKKIDIRSTGYGLLPQSELQTYRADWYDKTLRELENLFGYIA